MLRNNIVCFDFETSSADYLTTQILSIGAVAMNPRTYEIIEQSEFYSLVKPDDPDAVEQGALDVNKLTMEEIMNAPPADVIWNKFANYLSRYRTQGNSWGNPIPAGYNIVGFDIPIAERYAARFGQMSAGKQNIFHPRDRLDVIHDCLRWTFSTGVINSLKLDDIRDYLGMSKEGAHNSLCDAQDTAAILQRFMGVYKNLGPKLKLKNAFQKAA